MPEKIFERQINFGWGYSFNMTGKAPAVAKRIWNTYQDALDYANNVYDSAIEGILLSVVDDDDEKKNGVYFVQRIKEKEKENEEDNHAILVKVGSGDIEELETAFNEKIKNLQKVDASNKTELQTQITTLNTTASQLSSTIGTVADGQTVVDLIDATNSLVSTNKQNIDDNKKTIDAYTVNGKPISNNPVLSSDNLLVGENYSVLSQKAENVFPGDYISIAISKIEVMLANTTLALTAAINDLEARIGKPTEYNENGDVISEASGLYKKYEELSQQIETN